MVHSVNAQSPGADGNVGPFACSATPLASSLSDDTDHASDCVDAAESVDDDVGTVDNPVVGCRDPHHTAIRGRWQVTRTPCRARSVRDFTAPSFA